MYTHMWTHCCIVCTNTHVCFNVNNLVINEIIRQRAKVNWSTPKRMKMNYSFLKKIQKDGKREQGKVKADGTEPNS